MYKVHNILNSIIKEIAFDDYFWNNLLFQFSEYEKKNDIRFDRNIVVKIARKKYLTLITEHSIKDTIKIIDHDTMFSSDPTAGRKHDKAEEVLEKGIDILKALYDSIDIYPITCLSLAGGLVEMQIIPEIFSHNCGVISALVDEFKRFYIEDRIQTLIRIADNETGGYSTFLPRILHHCSQEVITYGNKAFKSIYELIDKHSLICLSILFQFIKLGILPKIFKKENSGKIKLQVKEFKEYYGSIYSESTI